MNDQARKREANDLPSTETAAEHRARLNREREQEGMTR